LIANKTAKPKNEPVIIMTQTRHPGQQKYSVTKRQRTKSATMTDKKNGGFQGMKLIRRCKLSSSSFVLT
jgi:hypothetical protein